MNSTPIPCALKPSPATKGPRRNGGDVRPGELTIHERERRERQHLDQPAHLEQMRAACDRYLEDHGLGDMRQPMLTHKARPEIRSPFVRKLQTPLPCQPLPQPIPDSARELAQLLRKMGVLKGGPATASTTEGWEDQISTWDDEHQPHATTHHKAQDGPQPNDEQMTANAYHDAPQGHLRADMPP